MSEEDPEFDKKVEDIQSKISFDKWLNVYCIWGVWYIQTFVMMVVMLNFIIAVITSTYDKVKVD